MFTFFERLKKRGYPVYEESKKGKTPERPQLNPRPIPDKTSTAQLNPKQKS